MISLSVVSTCSSITKSNDPSLPVDLSLMLHLIVLLRLKGRYHDPLILIPLYNPSHLFRNI